MARKIKFDNLAIVLHRPRYAGNIGSVARCALNMGVSRIIVVDPRERDRELMIKMGTHFSASLIDSIEYKDRLEEALGPFQYVVGTTGRRGSSSLRKPILNPKAMARSLETVSQDNAVALLFGSEDRGLSNDDLRLCDMLVTIPTAARMRSINLSHAVMIILYEIFTTGGSDATEPLGALATVAEREQMYDDLRDILIKINFVNPENPEYWMAHLRRFFSRTVLYGKDVKVLRGICRQIDNYGKGRTRDIRLDNRGEDP
ncbi:MAG: TrmJ/YjtD family RNA methyltransferase [Deltaproteobacteria bacterium]|nr:TrmJ/YjtD family RNA methyltransferase [Deltaproteobacteria bacterium]